MVWTRLVLLGRRETLHFDSVAIFGPLCSGLSVSRGACVMMSHEYIVFFFSWICGRVSHVGVHKLVRVRKRCKLFSSSVHQAQCLVGESGVPVIFQKKEMLHGRLALA